MSVSGTETVEGHFPNAATPEGSAAYYAVRFSAEPLRDALARRFAWRAELERIVEHASDPGVARLKLDWWRDELQRARQDAPRHPLAEALAADLATAPSLDAWLATIDAAEGRILKRQPDTTAEFAAQCTAAGGSLGEILAQASGSPGNRELDLARTFGTYAEAVWRIRDLALHLRRQWCPLPAELLGQAGLAPDRLHESRHHDALAKCLALLLAPLEPLAADYRAARRTAASPAARLAAQASVLHRATARAGYPVMHRRVEVAPLRLLWAAWRSP